IAGDFTDAGGAEAHLVQVVPVVQPRPDPALEAVTHLIGVQVVAVERGLDPKGHVLRGALAHCFLLRTSASSAIDAAMARFDWAIRTPAAVMSVRLRVDPSGVWQTSAIALLALLRTRMPYSSAGVMIRSPC